MSRVDSTQDWQIQALKEEVNRLSAQLAKARAALVIISKVGSGLYKEHKARECLKELEG